MAEPSVRLIAFYLPQFHPIAENDEWWGQGFTDWTNVADAKPLFPGHCQPHIPADLGFYDLRLPEAREAQAALARAHGIHGFCYYHYWFRGRRILERPFNEMLTSGRPDFPFCLCWANENWTRAWDGLERQILLKQEYSHEDDRAHIRSLMSTFRDPRYIRVDGKPLFLIYRAEHLPDPARTAAMWREEAKSAGIGDIYLARVEGFLKKRGDPVKIGFDAAVEFAPDWRQLLDLKYRGAAHRLLNKLGVIPDFYFKNKITRYEGMVRRMLEKPDEGYTWFRCVAPGFDNTPRRSEDAVILCDATPERYSAWLAKCIDFTLDRQVGDRRIVFINAWNEWGEGNHLEPDLKFGRAFLEATLHTLVSSTADGADRIAHTPAPQTAAAPLPKRLYWYAAKVVRDVKTVVEHATYRNTR